MRRIDKRRFFYALALAVVLSFPVFAAFVLASQGKLEKMPCLQFLPSHLRLAGLFLAAGAFIITLVASYVAFGKLPEWMDRADARKLPRFMPLTLTPRGVAAAFAVITVLWLPYFVIMFPGASTGYDTFNQLYQFLVPPPTFNSWSNEYVDADFIDGNPILDTLIFGAFVWFGKALGSDMFGYFLYCIVQALLTAALFAALVCYGEKLGLPPLVRLVFLVLVALCPFLPNAAYTMQKDSIFALFFTAYSLLYLEVFRTRGKALHSPRFFALFLAVACLSCLSKQTGAYAVYATCLVLVIALKGSRIVSAAATLAPYLICSVLVPALVFPAIGVWKDPNPSPLPGGSHVLLQQSVTALRDHPEAYSEEDLATLDKVIDVDRALKNFSTTKTDAVSRAARDDATKEDASAYLSLWLRIGLKCPVSYAKSVIHCCGKHLFPTRPYAGSIGVVQSGIEQVEKTAANVGQELTLDIANPEPTYNIAYAVLTFCNETLSTIPVFSLLMSAGFYGGWIPLICLAYALFFNKRDAVALAPAIVTMLLLLVVPVSFNRYLVPSIYAAFPALLWAMHTAALRRPSLQGEDGE